MTVQRTLVLTTLLVTKDFAVKSNLLFDMGPSKASITDTFEQDFYELYVLCIG